MIFSIAKAIKTEDNIINCDDESKRLYYEVTFKTAVVVNSPLKIKTCTNSLSIISIRFPQSSQRIALTLISINGIPDNGMTLTCAVNSELVCPTSDWTEFYSGHWKNSPFSC
ncbi:hypothetical protein ACHAXS_001595 [Conticribra weissflogii]